MLKIIRDFKTEMLMQDLGEPISIEIGAKAAEKLKDECRMVLKYTTNRAMPMNHCLMEGVLIIAPSNFSFDVPRPSPDDFK